jgi:hypothetical protein
MSNEQVTVGDGPASHAETITPSDTTAIPSATRGLYVGSSGDVAVVMASGESVTFVSVPAGIVLPVRLLKVKATGTTASALVGLW